MSAAGPTSRAVALRALLAVEDGGWAHVVTPRMLRASDLAPRDRAFVTELVAGTLRWRRLLDHRLAELSTRPLDRLDPPVRAALRLGAYQLRVGVAAHAAVGATVAALPRRSSRARGYVNAVLRRLAALGTEWPLPTGDDATSVGIRTSHPDWIVATFREELGAEAADALLALDNTPPWVTLRPNPRTDTAGLRAELEALGAHVEPGALMERSLRVRGIGDPAALAAVSEGRATPQDEASQAVADLVGATGAARVLDVAAAPGGKATAIAERLDDRGAVVAADLAPGRLSLVRAAARRLELADVPAVVADGRACPVRPGSLDHVLVDAPCSGLGVLRRRADARWHTGRDDVPRLVALQQAMLDEAADAVREGGVLVYAVCTLTAAETVEVDAWLQRARPDLVAVDPPPFPWRPHGRGALLVPTARDTDGMFVARYRREAS